MGVVIDLHEVSEYKDTPSFALVWHYNRFKSKGMMRAAHPIIVEMHYRAVMASESTQPTAS